MVDAADDEAEFAAEHFWSAEACVAVNVACVRSNIDQIIFVNEREICGEGV